MSNHYHRDLIDAAQAIGDVAQMGEWASLEVAEKLISRHPVAVRKLTVGQLLDVIREDAEVRTHAAKPTRK